MASLDYFERKLDGKRRLTIPSELRAEFEQAEVVVTRGFGSYLHLYTKQVWESQVEPRLKGDILSEEIADLNVKFRTGRVEIRMDAKQGRITLEQHHLDWANIKNYVVAVRAGAYWRLMAKPE